MKKAIVVIGILAVVVAAAVVVKNREDKSAKIEDKPPVEYNNDSDKKDEEKTPTNQEKEPDKIEPENKTEDKVEDKVDEKETEETPEADKEDKDNSEGNSRPEAFYVEELMLNFSTLYQAVINKDNIEISILDNVIMPNSEFSEYMSKEIKAYKDKKVVMKFETFDIESIKEKDKDSFEVTVNQVISTTIEGVKEEKREKAAYIVRFTRDRMGIDQLIIKN